MSVTDLNFQLHYIVLSVLIFNLISRELAKASYYKTYRNDLVKKVDTRIGLHGVR